MRRCQQVRGMDAVHPGGRADVQPALSGAGRSSAGDCVSAFAAPLASKGAKNVLYLIVDDLRTQLGAYGHTASVTPHIDALAASGARFTHAYCQQAVCAPSRASFMTGLRPDSLRLWTFVGNFRQSHPDWTSLPQHFKDVGYTPVLGGGKTFHPNRPPNYDEPKSWTSEMPYFSFFEPGCPFNASAEPGANGYTHSVCVHWPRPTHHWPVSSTTSWRTSASRHCIWPLRRNGPHARAMATVWCGLSSWAAGFRRPHLPWRMPKRFWDLFDDDSLGPPVHPNVPEGMPPVAWTCGDRCAWELANRSTYDFSLATPVEAPLARMLRRAYLASMAFMDSEVGRVLAELDPRAGPHQQDAGAAARRSWLGAGRGQLLAQVLQHGAQCTGAAARARAVARPSFSWPCRHQPCRACRCLPVACQPRRHTTANVCQWYRAAAGRRRLLGTASQPK